LPIDGGIANNLTNVIMNSLLTYGGLIMEENRNKLIFFGSNGVDVFKSVHNGLKTQF